MANLRQQLDRCLQGRVCLLGLGNIDHGDDGFGVRLAEALMEGEAWKSSHRVIVAGTAPERFIGRISDAGFDHVIFLDAVDFGGAPGSVVFLNSGEIAARFPQISTHQISLGVLAKWAESNGTTSAWLLGVQPESLRPSGDLTARLEATFELVRELLRDVSMEACIS
jgi:hydrogenase maturation protease